MHRPTLGIVAFGFLVGGLIAMIWRPEASSEYLLGGLAVRVGAVLGVIWLALPEVRRTSKRTLLVVSLLALVVVLRPRLLLVVAPIALALALLLGRSRNTQKR